MIIVVLLVLCQSFSILNLGFVTLLIILSNLNHIYPLQIIYINAVNDLQRFIFWGKQC